jgi:peptidoglycan hydrolase-like protein with peptidoglycan-binding domain
MLSHADARQLCAAAFSEQMAREGTRTELQCLQAIGWLETNYASSWHGPGVGSNNWGAIQQGPWSGAVFSYTDTNPNADGTSTPYVINFRKYPNPVAGALDLCKVVYCAFDRGKRVLPAATRGDLLAFSTELHRAPEYYAGFGATDAIRIAHHHAAVVNAIRLQCATLGEDMPEDAIAAPVVPALLLGATGPAVAAWQAAVGVTADGVFGAQTQTATRAWQTSHGLPANGVVQEADLVAAGFATK